MAVPLCLILTLDINSTSMDFNQPGIHGIGREGSHLLRRHVATLSSLFPNRLATAHMAFTKHLSRVTREDRHCMRKCLGSMQLFKTEARPISVYVGILEPIPQRS